MGGAAIGCQTQAQTTASSAAVSAQAAPTEGIYRNARLGFQFSYPKKSFVVDLSTKVPPQDSTRIASIEIWTQQHYQKLKAGAYEGGTEYPANVQVAVYQNPKKLGLRNWVQHSDRFAAPTQFKSTTIAARSGITFQSTGLYEHEHVAFQSSDTQIILITLSKTGYGNNDAIYRTAFDQIIRSFQKV